MGTWFRTAERCLKESWKREKLMIDLRQIWDLSRSDFERHTVWIGVHNYDVGKPWHKTSNEGAYRPWDEGLPARSEAGFVLVRAVLELRCGERHPGFFTAVRETWDVPPRGLASISVRCGGPELGLVAVLQPRIFWGDQQIGFWGGRKGAPTERREALYSLLGKAAEDIFPIRFGADGSLATGIVSGEVKGFYRLVSKQPTQIEF
jgi:hypothetical protein